MPVPLPIIVYSTNMRGLSMRYMLLITAATRLYSCRRDGSAALHCGPAGRHGGICATIVPLIMRMARAVMYRAQSCSPATLLNICRDKLRCRQRDKCGFCAPDGIDALHGIADALTARTRLTFVRGRRRYDICYMNANIYERKKKVSV